MSDHRLPQGALVGPDEGAYPGPDEIEVDGFVGQDHPGLEFDLSDHEETAAARQARALNDREICWEDDPRSEELPRC